MQTKEPRSYALMHQTAALFRIMLVYGLADKCHTAEIHHQSNRLDKRSPSSLLMSLKSSSRTPPFLV